MASSISNWVDADTEQEQALANQVGKIKVNDNGYPQNADDFPPPAPGSEAGSVETEISEAEKSLLRKIIRKDLIEDSGDTLIVKQKDPTSPLFSATSFEELNLRPELLKGVYDMKFNAPSRIQETALPYLLQDPPKNLIAQSQSGTGKTAVSYVPAPFLSHPAFVLSMLSRVDFSLNYPQILCLSPTYELAIQTGEVVNQMGKFCPEIRTIFAVKGVVVDYHQKLTDHIIIGTPGKVTDWGLRQRIFDLSKIKVFVLDEADVMIATQGYQDESLKIKRKLPADCQYMLFSATYDPLVMEFAEKIVPDPLVLRLKKEEESLDNIRQYYIPVNDAMEKYNAIANIYGVITIGQAMIFCHTRKAAAWLATKMTKDGHAVGLLSGELTVDQRIAVLTRFRNGTEKVLITTNVMARGIDIESITLVVNFDLPVDVNGYADCETYLHRIGRTGRFGKKGIAINMVDSERSNQILNEIANHFGKKIVKLNPADVYELEQIEK